MNEAPTIISNLSSCSVLELMQLARREWVAFHLVDNRLIVHPHRTRQDLADALIARADEVADFLRTHHPYQWRTPPEEEAYRRAVADEMCLTLFSMPWAVCQRLVIAALAEVVGEAWERHVARIPPMIEDASPWRGGAQ